jgi:hypothetical protein
MTKQHRRPSTNTLIHSFFQSEASFGYVGIIQNGPILQNLKEDHRDNRDNN